MKPMLGLLAAMALAATVAACAPSTGPEVRVTVTADTSSPSAVAGDADPTPGTADGAGFAVDPSIAPERQLPANDDGTAGSGCTPGGGPLPDGIWYGIVEDWSGGVAVFDLVCVRHPGGGDDASVTEGPPTPVGGYEIENGNAATRDVPVAEGARFYPPDYLWYPESDPGTFEDVTRVWGTGGYWLYVNDGQITAAVAALND